MTNYQKTTTKATEKAKKSMLSINPKALQGLHVLLGFDFQTPHTIAHIKGAFTVNAALKAAGMNGADAGQAVALLVIGHESKYTQGMHLATVDGAGRLNIDYRGGYRWSLENLVTKKTFEDIRKSSGAELFVIRQAAGLLRKPGATALDRSARLEVVPKTERYYQGKLFQVAVKQQGTKKDAVELNFYRHEYQPTTLADVIDHSGFLLIDRRDDLKRRAAILRAERLKAAYLKTDDSGKVEQLRAMIERRKKQLAAQLAQVDSSKALAGINDRMGWSGFLTIMHDFEIYAERTEKRNYISIDAANYAYQRIFDELTEALADGPEVPEQQPEQQRRADIPEKTWIGTAIQGAGYRMEFSQENERTMILFDGKPTDAARMIVEETGFYYSGRLGAWVKGLTWKAYRAANRAAERLNALKETVCKEAGAA